MMSLTFGQSPLDNDILNFNNINLLNRFISSFVHLCQKTSHVRKVCNAGHGLKIQVPKNYKNNSSIIENISKERMEGVLETFGTTSLD